MELEFKGYKHARGPVNEETKFKYEVFEENSGDLIFTTTRRSKDELIKKILASITLRKRYKNTGGVINQKFTYMVRVIN